MGKTFDRKSATFLADVLRAEAKGVDLVEGTDYRLYVRALGSDGIAYTIGSLDIEFVKRAGKDVALQAISRIKFHE